MLAIWGLALASQAAAAGEEGTGLVEKAAAANKAKDAHALKAVLANVPAEGAAGANTALSGPLAVSLAQSLRVFKSDRDLRMEIVDALGKLRTKRAKSALKRIALRRKVKDPQEQELQARALLALGKFQEPGLIEGIGKQAKTRSLVVATADYRCFASYEGASGRVRKRVAEFLMKRMELEYPAYSNSNGKWISAEKRQRWRAVSSAIVRSLQAVTGQETINDIGTWREWWRENKASRRAWSDKNRGTRDEKR